MKLSKASPVLTPSLLSWCNTLECGCCCSLPQLPRMLLPQAGTAAAFEDLVTGKEDLAAAERWEPGFGGRLCGC